MHLVAALRRTVPPIRLALVVAACMAAGMKTGDGATVAPAAASCALQLAGRDASGNTVLQTVAYALDQPGLVLAPLSGASLGRPRWQRLQATPDPALAGVSGPERPIEVTEILLEDPSRDLVLLRAPGIEACDESGTSDADAGSTTPHGIAPLPADGDSLIGIRNRDGYRPRLFQARLERRISTGSGPELMRIRIPDGGGASAGFLLDRRHRLLGSILAPPAGADRLFACAVPIDRASIEVAAGRPGRTLPDALTQPPPDEFARTPAGLIAQALVLTRDDQTDLALRLLDDAVRLGGESDVLLVERGSRRFRIGRTEAAIQDFARAAALSPRLHVAHFNLGVALGSAGRFAEAAEAFDRALRIDPGHAQTRYQLALALYADRRADRARDECDRLERVDAKLGGELRALLNLPTAAP